MDDRARVRRVGELTFTAHGGFDEAAAQRTLIAIADSGCADLFVIAHGAHNDAAT
ncbi:hypothetical protein [Streptomyces sp. YIM 130001]|uniref:hypothetical protein n=1 Tax=Streptomyces sp. YIM 130001 TaxID=2259644 RepID=UPI0013C40F95|nr:hypothetical protein [Streptomyces sp. YIM 130001]